MTRPLDLRRLPAQLDEALRQVTELRDSVVLSEGDTPVAALIPLERLSPDQQARLDELVESASRGALTSASRAEYAELAREAEAIALRNARRLTGF